MVKRIFSVFLILLMIISSLSFPTYAESNEEYQIQYNNEFDTLTALGIINTADGSGKVRKIDFLEIIYKMYFENMVQSETDIILPYSDVPKDSAYYNAVCFAYKSGLIGEAPGRKLFPEDGITVNECVEILAMLCGYDKGAFSQTQAFKRELLNSVSLKGTDLVNMDVCAKLIFEAVTSDMLEKMPSSKGVKYIKTEGNTFLKNVMSIKSGIGVISETHYNSVDANEGNGRYIVINGESLLCHNPQDYLDYTGMKVWYFYKDKNGTKTLLHAFAKKHYNTVKIISAEDIVDVKNGVVSFGTENSSRIQKITITPGMSIMYNYALFNNTDDSVFDIDCGEIRFIDNNNDGKYDVLHILSYENYIVYAVDKTNKVIIDQYNGGRTIPYEAEDEWSFVSIENKSGSPVEITRLESGAVITALISKNKEIVRLIVSTDFVSGEVSGMNVKNETIRIDGIDYELSKSYKKSGAPTIEIGAVGNFYFDAFGKIAAYKNDVSLYKYGCLIACADAKNFTTPLRAKILTVDNEVKVFDIKDGAKIDNIKYKNGNPIPDVLKKTPQLVYYNTNSDGVITNIKTANSADNEMYIKQIGNSNTYTFLRNSTFAGYHEVTASAVIFLCPMPGTDAEDKDYKVIDRTGLTNVTSYGVKAYSTGGESFIADAFVVEETAMGSKVISTSPVRLVKEIGHTLVGDEIVYYISLFGGADIEEEVYTFKDEEYAISCGVQAGDIVKVLVDKDKNVRDLMLMYSYETGDYVEGSEAYGSGAGVNDATRVVYGEAVLREGNYLGITRPQAILGNTPHDSLEFFELGASQIYIVDMDSRDNNIRKGYADEIKDYQHYGDECSRVVVHTQNSWFSFCVVYI